MLLQVFMLVLVDTVVSGFGEYRGIISARHLQGSEFDAAELFRVKLYPGHDLVLRERSNPCAELLEYCKMLNITPAEQCIKTNLHRVQKDILPFSKLMENLDVDATLFMSCVDEFPFFDRSFHSEFYLEMLQLLQSSYSGDPKMLKFFDLKRNEVRMNASEEIDLYRRAVVLHPNSTYVLSQLGLTLQNHGYVDLARSVWENAVRRGLWPHVLHRPEWYYVPTNVSKPWHDPRDFPFAAKLQAGFSVIRREFLANMEHRQSLSKEELGNRVSVEDNQWKLLYLKEPFTDNYTRESLFFPETMKIIEDCDEEFLLIKFSAIVPGTHIKPHTGPSNDRLRVHLSLIHTGGARIRVGSEWRTWRDGEVLIFDSSWEHEVYHDGPDKRTVLILDIRNPTLS